jgi:hypothetical protein
MQLERTASSYAVEIPMEDMERLLDSEAISSKTQVRVHEQLDVKLMDLGCSKVEYSGHYGAYVYLTLAFSDDTPKMARRVIKTIQTHLAWLKGRK